MNNSFLRPGFEPGISRLQGRFSTNWAVEARWYQSIIHIIHIIIISDVLAGGNITPHDNCNHLESNELYPGFDEMLEPYFFLYYENWAINDGAINRATYDGTMTTFFYILSHISQIDTLKLFFVSTLATDLFECPSVFLWMFWSFQKIQEISFTYRCLNL